MSILPKWNEVSSRISPHKVTGYKLIAVYGLPGTWVERGKRRDHLKTIEGDLVRAIMRGKLRAAQVEVYYRLEGRRAITRCYTETVWPR